MAFSMRRNGVSCLSAAGTPVYEGMVVGAAARNEDIAVNVCKKKHVTNTRAAGSDDALRLVPIKQPSLEEALEFITDDELLEVTPQSLRIRKRILDNSLRMKAASQEISPPTGGC